MNSYINIFLIKLKLLRRPIKWDLTLTVKAISETRKMQLNVLGVQGAP